MLTSGGLNSAPSRDFAHLGKALDLVEKWLDGQYSESCESKMPDILEAILYESSPVQLYEIMRMLPDLLILAEGRFSMPLLNWAWLDPGDQERQTVIYSTLADVLHRTADCTTYAYGCGLRLHAYSGSKQLYYIAPNEVWGEEAPVANEFQKWYGDGRSGKGVTLSSAMSAPVPADGHYYWLFRPEIAILCALTKDRDELHRLVISVLISMAFVQAVGLSQGASFSKCDRAVKNMYASTTTKQIGGQVTVLAAVYSRLTSPREYATLIRPETSRYAKVPYEKVSVAAGIAPISISALSNNMYWLEELDRTENVSMGSGRYSVFGKGDALFVQDVRRPVRWFGTALVVIAVSVISVAFQDVCWAEKLEKFLNLLFTATVATVIGLASVHPEKNMLANVLRGRRRIADADAGGEELFGAVLAALEEEKSPGRFVEAQQASWVSDWNHGTTTLGRPVRLNELRHRKLSVSSSYELCVKADDSLRNLLLSLDGVGEVARPTTATDRSSILLESCLRVA